MSGGCDVAVVGGGMVGATLACALARGGIRVVLLDATNPERHWPPEPVDLRVSALTLASQNIFETLGAWPGMVDRGVSPYCRMRVWDADFSGALRFDSADTGDSVLGHIVENRVTVAALWDLLETLPSASVVCPAQVVDMRLGGERARLRLTDDTFLEAGLVVAADGRSSKLRALAGIGVTGWPYGQDGLVATVQTGKRHRETAYQRFLPEGPLAFLPLRSGACSIVWTASSESTKRNLAMDDEAFLDALQVASGGMLGEILAVGARAAFPLRFQLAERYTDDKFVLVGDAAHAMHPLAGQGANTGLLDAAALADVVLRAKRLGRPLGSARALRRYERWRKGDNLAMTASMDLLNCIYGISLAPYDRLRSAGMNMIDRTGVLKNFFNRYAMGARSDLPALAYGKPCW